MCLLVNDTKTGGCSVVRSMDFIKGWGSGYLEFGIAYCHTCRNLVALFTSSGCICGRWWFKAFLPSICCQFSKSTPFTKARGELSLFASSWPVAHFNCVTIAMTIWVDANKLRPWSLFKDRCLECKCALGIIGELVSMGFGMPDLKVSYNVYRGHSWVIKWCSCQAPEFG